MLKTEGTGAVVSLLRNGTDNYIAIVNRDFRNSMKLTIVCDNQVMKIMRDGSAVPANRYAATLIIDPGDIALYKWADPLD